MAYGPAMGGTTVETARTRRKAATRDRLLDAAVSIFTEGSVVTTPVEAVAAAAGVSKATLFFHFGSRIELLEHVATRLYVHGAEAWVGPTPGLRAFLVRYLALQKDPTTRLIWEIGDVLSADGRGAPDAAYRHLIDHIADRLREDGAGDRAGALAGVVAPAALLVARRVAFGQAGKAEVQRFLDHVDAVAGVR